MNCEFLQECPFFKGMSSRAINAMKEVYCRGNSSICARRQVAMAVGREQVPLDLCPNQDFRVQEIIRKVLSGG